MLKTCTPISAGKVATVLGGDVVGEVRAWKLFCLVPMMLRYRPSGEGSVGRDLGQRAEDSEAGKWIDLVNASSACRPTRRRFVAGIEEEDRPGVAARNGVLRGQVFRARHELTGAAFALEAAKTLAHLRRQRPQAEIK